MPLILEKLTPLPLPLSLVARSRLNDHFVLDERVRLLLVQAPPATARAPWWPSACRLWSSQRPGCAWTPGTTPRRASPAYFQALLESLLAHIQGE